jgi:50S ribosome-binding GTPase
MASTVPFTTPLPNVEEDPRALRVVLFGMPDAGKSSLLGALVQATHWQERVLRGKVVDLTNGLAELWRRVYEERQRETREEIVPYPVVFEPYPGDAQATPVLHVMLYDCDGRIANELLSQRQSLEKSAKPGKLAKAILNADALILAIDASAGNEQLETDFREFVRFLRIFETQRSHRRAVGGLPVFLALTKCDRLVKEPVAKLEWAKRISERQKQVKERFAHYLEGNAGPGGPLVTFGSLEMRVFPTAVKWPPLADSPDQRAPLGVAELFHDCLRSAYEFRRRCDSANSRLRFILAAAAGFFGIAALFVFLLLRTGGPVAIPLALTEKVAQFESRDKPLPGRLADNLLQRRANELTELRDHRDFDKLPDDKRNFVRDRLDELQSYLRLREQVAQVAQLSAPEKARSLMELNQIQQRLEDQAAIPEKYQQDWAKSPPPAVVERDRLHKDCLALREGVEELKTFYAALKNKANDRLFDTEFSGRWEEQVAALFDNETNPPFRRGEGTKGTAYEYDEVVAAEKEWLAVGQKLRNVRDMALALGLIGDPGPAAVLVMTSIPADADIKSVSAARFENLKRQYPDWKTWSLAAVPDALRGELRKKLNHTVERMIQDGQHLILDKLRELRPSGPDKPNDWKEIGTWLTSPSLQGWRDLLGFAAKLLDPTAEDPATAAASFMQKDSFDMQLKALTVHIPTNLPQGTMVPGETMRIHFEPRDGKSERITLSFRIDRSATVEEVREKKYRFNLEGGDGKLIFKPGDAFDAELPLTKGMKAWEFIWSKSGTASFAFGCLTREPLLRAADATEGGSIAEGVTVSIDGRFPAIPALLPNVLRDRK